MTTDYTSNNVNEYTTVGRHDLRIRRRRQSDLDDRCLGNDDLHVQLAQPACRRHLADRGLVYQYDALGNLVATTAERPDDRKPGRSDGLGNLVGQFTSSGSRIAGYTYGLGLVSQVTPSGTNYYQFDALGSTAGMTNATSGLVASYSYLPFGGLLVSTGSVANPFTYVGAVRRDERWQRASTT